MNSHKRSSHLLSGIVFLFLFLACLGSAAPLFAYPVAFTDSSGAAVVVTQKPQRVVSLVPAVTEIIFQLGAGEALKGLTYHDTDPPEANQKEIVGGFFNPSSTQVEALDPDMIFLSSLHQEVREHFSDGRCRMLEMESRPIKDLYDNIRLLGMIFQREEAAEEIVRNIDYSLQLISQKIDKIPPDKRKRVMRFMGRDRVMTPGNDSFQNDFIRAAGGIPPELGKQGNVAEVTLDEWLRFNPQVIYGCGGDQELAGKFFSQPGWKDVEAIRSGNVFYFPCELTCRASVHTGEFVSWLASTIYSEVFAETKSRVLEEKRVGTTPLDIPLEYVRSARVDESTIFDFPNKSLVVELREPMRVTSTLEGERTGILTVGNHYTSPPCWSVTHRLGLEECRNHIYKAIGKSKKNSCFLFTGADMGNLSVRKSQFGDLSVYAMVTAGVKSNAVRMSMDEGRFVEPGTINVILMANRKLTPRAMTRAIISATEAKTAALQDLDVRSCSNPQRWQATGTGTDEVLVVEGRGGRIDNAGGHCKLGELVAKAVYEGVKEAVYRQNGITAQRNVFRRLQERHVNPYGMLRECACFSNDGNLSQQVANLEGILLQPRYAAFMESAFALSDAYERGLISELVAYQWWCHQVAEEIAGRKITGWKDWVTSEDIPVVVRISLNALLNGMKWRTSQE